MAAELVFVKNIEGIPFYRDSYMKEEEILVCYKSKEVDSTGYIYVDTQKFNEALSKCKGAPIEKKEVDKILKRNRNRNFSDIKAIICNINFDDKDREEKLINLIKKKFK
jgi:hypothetical protein